MKSPQTLVVSAWSPELAWLTRWLRTADGKRVAPAVACVAAGVGAVDAAAGTARAIARRRPRRVVFVGTAGFYESGAGAASKLALESPAVATRLLLVSTAVLRRDAYTPGPMVDRLATARPLTAALLQAHPAAVRVVAACPLAITRTLALGRQIAASGARVENLEAFAVGRAAAQAGVPFAAVFGIANAVGPRAHAQWRAHHEQASRAACQVIAAWLAT